ncbi:MAG TPA: hypothetical protein VEJ86_09580 [Candidatus Binataceae bacterium]|nr:hypothetical protein [Candidatus Binataceae bacterium]
MKKVEAIIRESRLNGVRAALARIGVGISAIEPTRSRLKIGVIVEDELVPTVVNTLEGAGRSSV